VTREEYRAALDDLFRRRRFGLRPGLETVQGILAGLGHPERKFPAIHITGSKGKGSTAVMAQSILTASGLRTGLFTSPHLATYRERARIDHRLIPRSAVVDGIRRVEATAREAEAAGTIDRPPTFFEATPPSPSTGSPARRWTRLLLRSGSGAVSTPRTCSTRASA